jgi:glutamyl-tRNA reductase
MSSGAKPEKIKVALIGCNHRTAPVELRERIAFSAQQALEAAGELRRQGILEEAVVVSTCNRSELYGVPGENAATTTEAMEDFLAGFHRMPRKVLDGKTFRYVGTDAVRHLFQVAAGLDSMLLGEAEILGQLRTAYSQALEHGATGPVLNRAFQGALEVGKRVRSETEVGTRPMSVALAGVKLAERVFGNLKGHRALIVGAGAVADQVLEHLRSRGIGGIQVVNRSYDRAAELAERMDAQAIRWEAFESVLAMPDVVVTSVSGGAPILTREMLQRAIEARGGRPMFVIDLGVPRNVDAKAAGLYSLYLYNIDDLGEIVEQNKKARESEVPRAQAIIDEQISKFELWRANLEASSIGDDLHVRFHEHREQFLRERLAEMDDVTPEERERLLKISSDLIDHLLHQPKERLRNGRGMRGRLGAVEALRQVFGLDENLPDSQNQRNKDRE